MEIKTELLTQAIDLYADVVTANQATKIARDLQDKMHMKALKEDRLSKHTPPAVLFSKELNLKVNASDDCEPLLKKDVVLTKADITFNTFHVYDDVFCSFYLTLKLHSRNNVLHFCVAKTKDENSKDYMVVFFEKKFMLQKGDNTEVKFSSQEDMSVILDFCNEAIAAINAKVEKDYQLVTHYKIYQ
jgi:hypothetical protein